MVLDEITTEGGVRADGRGGAYSAHGTLQAFTAGQALSEVQGADALPSHLPKGSPILTVPCLGAWAS